MILIYIFSYTMNILSKKSRVGLLVLLTSASTFAAPGAPPPPTPPPPPGLPIDGGIVLLLVVAICYGVYTVRKFNLQSK